MAAKIQNINDLTDEEKANDGKQAVDNTPESLDVVKEGDPEHEVIVESNNAVQDNENARKEAEQDAIIAANNAQAKADQNTPQKKENTDDFNDRLKKGNMLAAGMADNHSSVFNTTDKKYINNHYNDLYNELFGTQDKAGKSVEDHIEDIFKARINTYNSLADTVANDLIQDSRRTEQIVATLDNNINTRFLVNTLRSLDNREAKLYARIRAAKSSELDSYTRWVESYGQGTLDQFTEKIKQSGSTSRVKDSMERFEKVRSQAEAESTMRDLKKQTKFSEIMSGVGPKIKSSAFVDMVAGLMKKFKGLITNEDRVKLEVAEEAVVENEANDTNTATVDDMIDANKKALDAAKDAADKADAAKDAAKDTADKADDKSDDDFADDGEGDAEFDEGTGVDVGDVALVAGTMMAGAAMADALADDKADDKDDKSNAEPNDDNKSPEGSDDDEFADDGEGDGELNEDVNVDDNETSDDTAPVQYKITATAIYNSVLDVANEQDLVLRRGKLEVLKAEIGCVVAERYLSEDHSKSLDDTIESRFGKNADFVKECVETYKNNNELSFVLNKDADGVKGFKYSKLSSEMLDCIELIDASSDICFEVAGFENKNPTQSSFSKVLPQLEVQAAEGAKANEEALNKSDDSYDAADYK